MRVFLKHALVVALAVVGLYWVVAAGGRELPRAVASHGGLHYTTTWDATKLLTVESSGGWQEVEPQEIPIGVTEWRVVTVDTTTQEQVFTETWATPSINGTVFNPANQTTTGTGFNPQEWLFASHIGVFGNTPNGGRVTYRIKDLSFLNNSYKYANRDVYAGGNSIKCDTTTDSNCLHVRGSYGWEVYHALSNLGSERGRISASGVMMPLKWTVTGTLN